MKFGIGSNFLSSVVQTANADVVRELLEHHQYKFGDWNVADFNRASLYGNMPVLRLLSLSLYGGCEKLANTPPLNRICTRKVLGEMHVKSACVLMWCIKKNTKSLTMAKLLDVLRDLVSGDLLRYKMM